MEPTTDSGTTSGGDPSATAGAETSGDAVPLGASASTGSGAEPNPDAMASPSAIAPTADSQSRRAALLRSGILILVLFVVFGLILPRFVDYQEVAQSLAALSIQQIVVMTVLGLIAWFVCGQLFTVLTPGITPLRGMVAYLILSGIGSSIPFGPWSMGVVWVVFRNWRISFQDSTSGIALYGIINTLSRFALPIFAIGFILMTGELGTGRRAALVISIISGAIFVIAVIVMLTVVRSDRAANKVAEIVERFVSWILRKLGRHEQPDVDGSIHRFRDSVGDLVRRRGLAGLGVTLLAQVPWSIAFVTALRFTGVPADIVSSGEIIGVFALVAVITIIPISPGGAGVPELLYISFLSAIAGPDWEAQITAGVFLFRLYVWFLPIPIAWILLKAVRRGKPVLPTTAELKGFTSTAS
ncbi:MAG TPA: lysylphosphatidylglycerol synthase domain-containing protein [Candidatus Limnocylindrales bacterium]